MFRLHKNKPVKSGERIDFRFSQFKALQVPKGWEKLYVSIISEETGKTIAKTSKSTLKNGICQWTETVSESIWIPQNDPSSSSSSKELEDSHYKLVLSMGSSRSGILGEALVNMITYMSSSDPVQVSFPLKKCNHGTSLQVKIQCLTPRLNVRETESKETNSQKENLKTNTQVAEMKSEESDNSFVNSARSYSSRDLSSKQQEDNDKKGEEVVLQEVGLSSSSNQSYNSAENSMEKEGFSASNGINGEEQSHIARQDSNGSQNSLLPPGSFSDNSSFNSRITHSVDLSQDDPQEFSVRNSGSSRSLLEAAEATIEDLRNEGKTWEKNARNLMSDLEMLRKEHTEVYRNKVNLDMELSETKAERDGLQKEVEKLKMLLEKSTSLEDSRFRDKGINNVITELENEIKFQKESNSNLSLQLNKSQESNVELISVLQELEETVEKQKAELENLSALQLRFSEMESSLQVNSLAMEKLKESEKNLQAKVAELEKELDEKGDKEKEIELLKAKLQEVETDCQELTEENLDLLVKIKEMKNNSAESSDHESEIRNLEEKIRKKVAEEIESDYKLSVQELENLKLELESKVTELNGKTDLEILLSELEQENAELSACISGLEDQIRNLTYSKKSTELELQDSKSNEVKFRNEIANLRNEVENQKMGSQKKLKELLNLEEENSLLQKSINELKLQNLDLKRHCENLEVKLKDSQRNFTDCSKRVNDLQSNISSLIEESASKERILSSDMDELVKENKKQKIQIQNLEREVEELSMKLSATQEEKERTAKLESELYASQIESREKIQVLMDQLASSKQTHETLKAENEKILKSLENYKSGEEKLKNTLNGIELKLAASEYEKQQVLEESANLKTKLQKLGTLQDQTLALKNEASAIKAEKEKLENSLNQKAEECKELKVEKNLFIDKITDLQKKISELEECKEENMELEEKVQKLETEIVKKETLWEKDADVKNELGHVRRANKQLQQQLQQNEEQKEKFAKRIQILEEELISMKEKQRNSKESRFSKSLNNQQKKDGDNPVGFDSASKIQYLEDDLSNGYKLQVKRLTNEGKKGRTGSPKKSKVESEFISKEKFERTKSSLEAELKEIKERYLHMSLKYAEVEAQREELVMKLKATCNNGKRWF